MNLRPFFRAVILSLTAVLALALWPGAASAHSGDQTYLYLDVAQTAVGGRIEAPIGDLNEALGLDLGGTDPEIVAGIQVNFDAITGYLEDHLAIGAEGTSWAVEFTESELFFSDLPEADDNYVLFYFEATPTIEPVPRELDITFDPFVDEISGRNSLLLISNDWQAGVIDNGYDVNATFDGGSRSQVIDLGDTSRFKNLTESMKLGVDHIRTGPDHILFVLVLLLPAVLVFTTRWEPAKTWHSSLWRVLKILTMFTVAHSITFTLAGLGILPLPSPRIVESIIALSIAAAALHNIHPIARNKEWLISFAFGLFHGMGFASLVSGLDVDRSTQLISLLGRNIGIEIGQAVVVLLLFPSLFILRRTRYYQPFLIGFSLLLAVVSLGWFIERAFVTDLSVSSFVDPVIVFPRVLFFIAAFTVFAYFVERFERSRGRLLPVVSDEEQPTEQLVTTG